MQAVFVLEFPCVRNQFWGCCEFRRLIKEIGWEYSNQRAKRLHLVSSPRTSPNAARFKLKSGRQNDIYASSVELIYLMYRVQEDEAQQHQQHHRSSIYGAAQASRNDSGANLIFCQEARSSIFPQPPLTST
jgi:hypothetical protein